MRIVQLIDSLEAGGAERMAVTYANALSNTIEFSGLVATRNEGALKNHLHSEVEYLFLEKKSNFDLKAFLNFRNFIIKNNVQIIHAHGSSFFWATLLKVSRFETKIIWHIVQKSFLASFVKKLQLQQCMLPLIKLHYSDSCF